MPDDPNIDTSNLPMPDPQALQQALMAASMPQPGSLAGQPGLPQGASQIPPQAQPPPQQMPPQMPPVDLGSGDSQQQQVPKQSLRPTFMDLFAAATGKGLNPKGSGGPIDLSQGPRRPNSRLDAFESFLGNFLNSFSQGMSNAGTGPAANARGFGSAVQAPYQRELQQYGLGQQQQQVQSAVAGQQAESQLKRAQGNMMPVQVGGQTYYLPSEYAKSVIQSQIGAQAKTDVAGLERYKASPFGIFDQQTGTLMNGTGPGGVAGLATITAQMAKQFDIDPQYIGKQVKNSDLIGFMNAKARQTGVAQGSEGAFLFDKGQAEATGGKQGVTPLGQGSPAANPIAQAKLNISTAQDYQKVQSNQNQVNLALDRLQDIQKNADVVNSAIDAGRISITMGPNGMLTALAGRGVKLTPTEAKFASDFQSMSEDINLLRIPLGAAGFRGEEGWAALQSQRGSLSQNPDVFKGVLQNTIDSFKGLQSSNQQAMDKFDAAISNGKNKATGGGAGKGALTPDLAQSYLSKAGGNKDTARKLAKADGYTF